MTGINYEAARCLAMANDLDAAASGAWQAGTLQMPPNMPLEDELRAANRRMRRRVRSMHTDGQAFAATLRAIDHDFATVDSEVVQMFVCGDDKPSLGNGPQLPIDGFGGGRC